MHDDGTLTINTSTALSTFHTPEGKNVILITVKDTGKGINSDIKQMIFNPFFSTKNGHAGLGLPISYQIIKRHGGVLSCNNSEAGETQFTIELPIDQTQADGEKK